MGHIDYCATVVHQTGFNGFTGADIQMVGGFIQYQQVGTGQQAPGQGYASQLPLTEICGFLGYIIPLKAQGIQEGFARCRRPATRSRRR